MYDAAWFESLAQYRTFNERALWAILAHLDRPTSYLDVGCGDGWMVRAARRAGCNPSIGIECSQDAKRIAGKWARIVVHDVTKPITLRWQFELVSSIEVAEHLQPEGSEAYIGNLVRHTSKWLVFTAAIPGQGGDGHINCQPTEFWRELILRHGLNYESETTERLRETWKWVTGPMFWLPQNLQIFKRNT